MAIDVKKEAQKIEVLGAREHNLKNIDVSIPRNKLTVITGLSGSGKSSLAFDILFSEGRRRYLESLAPYVRQFVGVMERPEVDANEKVYTTLFERKLLLIMGVAGLLFVPVFKTVTHLPPYMGMLLSLSIIWMVTELIHAKKSDEMGFGELYRYIQKVESEGYDAVKYRTDLHAKFAFPLVCVIMSLAGIGIAVRGTVKGSMHISIALGIGLAFLYWVFSSFCMSLGYAKILPPVVAAWVANVVFLCLGGIYLIQTE